MKRLMAYECMSQQFTKVLGSDHPDAYVAESTYAVFSASIETGVFCGLVAHHDVTDHPGAVFADLLDNTFFPVIKNNTTVRQALAIMKHHGIDRLPMLTSEGRLEGIVKQSDLLQKLYQREQSLLLAGRKRELSLLRKNRRQKKIVEAAKARIRSLSLSDFLTGLPNLTQLRDHINQLITEAQQQGAKGAVLLIGLDNFKDVNDLLGSSVGDLLLQQVSLRIAAVLGPHDLLARKGGDEFVVVFYQVESFNTVMLQTKQLLRKLAEPFLLGDQELFITASAGICYYPEDADGAEALLAYADIALGAAKEKGKNNYQIFVKPMGDRVYNIQKMQKQLHLALQNHELFVHYQPQVDIQQKCVMGMEALLRWKNPEFGLVLPGTFIPLAEKTGLIRAIGDWVLCEACEEACRWQKDFPALRVAVNLSARQFQDIYCKNARHLIKVIEEILERTALPPERLEIEITESLIMIDYEAAMTALKKMKELGIRISCDDFGTGYSSLNYIKRFPIDTIKIDKFFIDDMVYEPVDVAIIRAIIDMAQRLNVEVIAEGVENKEQLRMLSELGCHMIQGYYFSRPLAVEAINLFLNRIHFPNYL